MRRPLIVLLLTGLGLGWSCSGQDGDKRSTRSRFEAQNRSFSLQFSDPPWRVVDRKEDSLRLQVDSEIFGIELGDSIPPMHILVASPVRLDQHLTELIDPDELHDILVSAGVDPDKIPEDLATIDSSVLATVDTEELSKSLGNASIDTATFTTLSTGSSSFPSTVSGFGTTLQSGPGVVSTKETAQRAAPRVLVGHTRPILPTGAHQPVGRVPKIPEYLRDVDILNPRDVAVAEINLLVRENQARIVSGLSYFETEQGLKGVSYQLAMPPGVFVRNLYLPAQGFVLRVGVLSLFELSNEDIVRMFSSVETNYVASSGSFEGAVQ